MSSSVDVVGLAPPDEEKLQPLQDQDAADDGSSSRLAIDEGSDNDHHVRAAAEEEEDEGVPKAEEADKSTASPCSVPEPPPPPPPPPSSALSVGGGDVVEVERSSMETRGQVSVKWDITRKNKTSIVIDGYKMTESRAGKDGRVFWRCSKRFCSATAISLGARLLSVRQVDARRFHNHPPTGKEEFFRGDFGSPGTPTQVTIKWPVTRFSAARPASSLSESERLRRRQLRLSGASVDTPEVDGVDDVGEEEEEEEMEAASFSSMTKRMRRASSSLDNLASIQRRLMMSDPLAILGGAGRPLADGGGAGGVVDPSGGDLQSLATTAAGLATAPSSGLAAGLARQQQQHQALPLLARMKQLSQQQRHYQHHSQSPPPPPSREPLFEQQQQQQPYQYPLPHQFSAQQQQQQQQHLASLEAQKAAAILSMALGGIGGGGTGGMALSPPPPQQLPPVSRHSQAAQTFNPIFNPPPQQPQFPRLHRPDAFSSASEATAGCSPLKEALSQIDNSQLRRQLRRLESYFRTGIVAVSDAICRPPAGGAKAQAAAAAAAAGTLGLGGDERDSLARLFNYMEGLERVHKLTAELP